MTDLTYVKDALNKAPPPMINDHPIQTQIDKVVSYIEHEKISEASVLMENIFRKGFLDIRIVAYYSYAYFFDTGIKSFSEIFPLLISVVTEHWENIKPANRKDKVVQNSLNWLVQELITKLKYLEKLAKKGEIHPLWTLSTVDITFEEVEHSIQKLKEFRDFFHEKWPQSPTEERIFHLLQIVNSVQEIKRSEIEEATRQENAEQERELAMAQVEQESFSADDSKGLLASSLPAFEPNGFPSQNDELPFSDTSEDEVLAMPLQDAENSPAPPQLPESFLEEASRPSQEALFNSDPMQLLCEKLQVFESLLKKNDHCKAALVAKDIDNIIENFDPLKYFPKLFSNYFALVARNIAALSEQWERKETLQIKYLEKLYKTDLDRFIDW